MRLIRCSEQTTSLRDFYLNQMKEKPKGGMCEIIEMLEKEQSTAHLTAYTLLSHSKLCLLNEDNSGSVRLVTIDRTCSPLGKFEVTSKMPDRLAPWPNAYVHGYGDWTYEVVDRIIAGVAFTEAWS